VLNRYAPSCCARSGTAAAAMQMHDAIKSRQLMVRILAPVTTVMIEECLFAMS
jgi:hypothetical protein